MTDIKEVIARVQRNLLCRTVDDFVLVKDTDLTYLIDAAEAGIAARDRIEELERALRTLADNKMNDGNCASVELAGRRVAAIARRALEAK